MMQLIHCFSKPIFVLTSDDVDSLLENQEQVVDSTLVVSGELLSNHLTATRRSVTIQMIFMQAKKRNLDVIIINSPPNKLDKRTLNLFGLT